MSYKHTDIIELHHSRKTNFAIVKLPKVPRITAYYTASRFKELHSTEDLP